MLELNKIYCGDCLELMKELDDNSVDLVLTDPPYGLNFPYYKYTDTAENLKLLINDYLPEVRRISFRVAITSAIKTMFLYPQPDWIISCSWDTTGSWGKYGSNQWFPVLLYGDDLKEIGKINGILKSDVIRISGGGSVGFQRNELERKHICPKPFNIIQKLILRLSYDSNIILDPFIGSGTTAVAAIRTGRNFIGMELSPECCAIAEKRIMYERQQIKLEL